MHVLAISDSSEINLQAQIQHLKAGGLGVVGNNQDVGFFLHPTLVANAENGFPLGLSTIQLWHRERERPDKHQRRYRQLLIEAKESYKWLLAAERSHPVLLAGGVAYVTYVGDRESDIYEAWARIPDAHTHLLMRACRDRCLQGRTTRLYKPLSQQPCQGTDAVEVMADPRIGRVAREAW